MLGLLIVFGSLGYLGLWIFDDSRQLFSVLVHGYHQSGHFRTKLVLHASALVWAIAVAFWWPINSQPALSLCVLSLLVLIAASLMLILPTSDLIIIPQDDGERAKQIVSNSALPSDSLEMKRRAWGIDVLVRCKDPSEKPWLNKLMQDRPVRWGRATVGSLIVQSIILGFVLGTLFILKVS